MRTKFNLITSRYLQVGSDLNGEASEDRFGGSVSMSSDGTIFAVGALDNNGNGTSAGHVRVYQFNSLNGYSQLGFDMDGNAAGDLFGTSVSISADGTTIVASARRNTAGVTNSGYVRAFRIVSESTKVPTKTPTKTPTKSPTKAPSTAAPISSRPTIPPRIPSTMYRHRRPPIAACCSNGTCSVPAVVNVDLFAAYSISMGAKKVVVIYIKK